MTGTVYLRAGVLVIYAAAFYFVLDEVTRLYYSLRWGGTIKERYASISEYVPYLLPLLLFLWSVLAGDSTPRNFGLIAAIAIFYFQKNNKRLIQKNIQREIVDVVDYLVIADEAEIDFGDVLYLASETTRSPKLSSELKRASAEYSMTKDMVMVSEKLANRLGVEEARYLPLAAEQTVKVGTAGAILETLSETLHAKRNAEIHAKDKGNDYKVVVAAFLLAAGLCCVYFIPMLTAAESGLSAIFR